LKNLKEEKNNHKDDQHFHPQSLFVQNKDDLNWQRPLWEGDQEVEKSSGRNEPMWVSIHKCMETIPGISLYNYLYPRLAKMICLSYYIFCFSLTKSEKRRAEQVLAGS
jgi:hypothetical protein